MFKRALTILVLALAMWAVVGVVAHPAMRGACTSPMPDPCGQ